VVARRSDLTRAVDNEHGHLERRSLIGVVSDATILAKQESALATILAAVTKSV
jgi:hypothetical protein